MFDVLIVLVEKVISPVETVEATVMAPAPFVMLMPVPAVNVDFVSVLPVVLPISNCPFVYVVCPVPPFATAKVPANVNVPDVVIGPPLNDMPVVPPDASTEVTVPAPATAPHTNAEPSDFRNVSADAGAVTKLVEPAPD